MSTFSARNFSRLCHTPRRRPNWSLNPFRPTPFWAASSPKGDLDVPRGIQELEEARKLAPGSPQVRIALATAYAKAGRKEDAARERREFLRLRQEVDSTESPNSK